MKNNSNFKDETGKIYGRYTVLSRSEKTNSSGQVYWNCVCSCGNERVVIGRDLRSGVSQSCGCYQRETVGRRATKHSGSRSRLYHIWFGMKERCYNAKRNRFVEHGGRGIRVCEEWLNSFEEFRDWAISNGYDDSLSIDRIDNDGNYEPSNCRWTTAQVQGNNRRTNVVCDYNGDIDTIANLCRKYGLNQKYISRRLRRGWSVERAFSTGNTDARHKA